MEKNKQTTVANQKIEPCFSFVYRNQTRNLELLPQFDAERKDELWGIAVFPKMFFALRKNILHTDWTSIKSFAGRLYLKGKKGHLPSKDFIISNYNSEVQKKFEITLKFLRNNGIEVDFPDDNIWCMEEYNSSSAYMFLTQHDKALFCGKLVNDIEKCRFVVSFD